ncbi:hypothetical protein TNIN_59571 [Trichonephila inaurata madagascariensis]|uniref:Uncharacterized protein n=1 Tax=Trichonephila inaurata madagascariensis TaxID=2747483 RepID=A0A8X6I2Z0_9ARAC|nr:hypothetical protein TNIN_59571 [Trichonephila inaurata madagascariensis]
MTFLERNSSHLGYLFPQSPLKCDYLGNKSVRPRGSVKWHPIVDSTSFFRNRTLRRQWDFRNKRFILYQLLLLSITVLKKFFQS